MPKAKNLRLKIEYWPVERLRKYAKNAKLHPAEQVASIKDSIGEFGMIQPVLVDTTRGKDEIISGHGRLDALIARGDASVPVIPLSHLTPDQVKAFRVLDNRLAERGHWSPDLVSEEIAALLANQVPLATIGFDEQWIKENLIVPTAGESPADEPQPEPPKNPYVRTGDLWQLGEHRLMCGSAIDTENVAAVMGGAEPKIAVSDPPYGVKYDPTWRDNAGGIFGDGKAKMRGKVQADDKADWRECWELFPGDVIYAWGASLTSDMAIAGIEAAGFVRRSQIIWRKPHFLLSRGDYHWQHEVCWYAVRKGGKSGWNGSRKETTMWDIAGMNPAGRTRDVADERTVHGTQKPVACMTRPIENNSRPGDHVYEPFAGSGTTIIACEVTGRRCIAIEIDPAYVQIALERWEKFSGKKAKLVGCYAGEVGLGKSAQEIGKLRSGKTAKAGGKNAKDHHREPIRRARAEPVGAGLRPVAKRQVRARVPAGQPEAG